MKGRTRGWIIIGVDLLLVLGVYFLYTQIRGPARTPHESQLIRNGVTYTLKAREGTQGPVNLMFSMENRSDTSREVRLPEGIQLMLSDRKNVIYWKKQILPKNELTLSPGEQRSWESPVDELPSSTQNLHASFFIDENRQMFLKVNLNQLPPSP